MYGDMRYGPTSGLDPRLRGDDEKGRGDDEKGRGDDERRRRGDGGGPDSQPADWIPAYAGMTEENDGGDGRDAGMPTLFVIPAEAGIQTT